ncbi:hypothetical protein [Nitrososphaera sp.]|uniref:hypothetical protein n=1 Tax=Nitrososphaera sp. TaxID=1971748 RepID=UPI003D6E1C29
MAHQVAAENLQRPFTITIVYKGLPENGALNAMHGPKALEIISKYFREWAWEVLGIRLSDDDAKSLQDGKTVRLTQQIKPYYDAFYELVKEYTRIYSQSMRQQQ